MHSEIEIIDFDLEKEDFGRSIVHIERNIIER